MGQNPSKQSVGEQILENGEKLQDAIREVENASKEHTSNKERDSISDELAGAVSVRQKQIKMREQLSQSGDLTPKDTETYIREYRSKSTDELTRKLFMSWHQYAIKIVENIEGVWMFEPQPKDCLAMFRCRDDEIFHDIRVRKDLSTEIVEIQKDNNSPFMPDPLSKIGNNEVFFINEPPETVQDIIKTLGLQPNWEGEACAEGEHEFVSENTGMGTSVYCSDCGKTRKNLSYRGHNVPWGEAKYGGNPTTDIQIVDSDPTSSPKIKPK